MRAVTVAIAAGVFAGSLGAFAQAPSEASSLVVHISEGRSRAALAPVTTPYATGGPWAAVTAHGEGNAIPTASDFRIRTWNEGAKARVMVFAVSTRPDGTVSEAQIDTFVLSLGEAREVTATTKYNARPVFVSVSARQ